MRTSSWFLLGIMALLCGFYESTFVAAAPYPFNYFRPLLPAMAILLLLNRPYASYMGAGLGGALIDIFRPIGANFALARYMIISFILDAISELFITNRSLYGAWLLVFFARLMDLVLTYFSGYGAHFVLGRPIYFENTISYLWIVVFDLIFISLLFIAVTFFTKRFFVSVSNAKNKYDI
ncbi:MAG: hypothetical protein ACOYUZ_00415 [Patescibacteria group bacterium]